MNKFMLNITASSGEFYQGPREPKGDPKATAYTEKYCEEQHK